MLPPAEALHQLFGLFGAERGDHRGVEFLHAVARLRDARSFELSGAMRLAGMLVDKGETEQARALLAPIYEWYTEGFDTPDLKDAKTLLDRIG